MYARPNQGSGKRIGLVTTALLALLLAFTTTAADVAPPPRTLANLDRSRQRVLIVAPHPDDEALGSAGLAQGFLSSGSEVWVVLATNGDAYLSSAQSWFGTRTVSPSQWVEYGEERQRETLTALSRLGVTEGHVFFLSYPDSGIDDLWGPNWSSPWRSPFTQVAANPYSRSFTPGAAYTGEVAWRDFASVMDRVRPTLVLIPHPADTHQDHWSTSAFATTALEAWRAAGETWAKEALVYEYLVHWPDWPRPTGVDTNSGLSLPIGLENTNTWERLGVGAAHRLAKSRAITDYKTQAPSASSLTFLLSFSRAEELFAVPSVVQISGAHEKRSAVIYTPTRSARKPGTPVSIAFSFESSNELQVELSLSGQLPAGSNWLCSFYGVEPSSAVNGNLSVVSVHIWPGQVPQVQVTGLYEKSIDGSALTARIQAKLQAPANDRTYKLLLRIPLVKPVSDTFLFSVSTYNGSQLSDATPYHLVRTGPDLTADAQCTSSIQTCQPNSKTTHHR